MYILQIVKRLFIMPQPYDINLQLIFKIIAMLFWMWSCSSRMLSGLERVEVWYLMLEIFWVYHSIVNTNTCTTSTSQVKIYLKSSKKLLHVSVFDHLQGVTMFSLKSLLILTTVGCFYAKSGDVAACCVVCIGLYLKSAWVYVF